MRLINGYGKKSKQLNIAQNVNELLDLDGSAFLECTYRTLLRREIDHAGKVHYMERLSSGRNKVAILDEIMRSPEIQGKEVKCLGLDDIISKHRLQLKKNKFFLKNINKLQELVNKQLEKAEPYIVGIKSISRENSLDKINDVSERLDDISKQLFRLNGILEQNTNVISSNNVTIRDIGGDKIRNTDHIISDIDIDYSSSLKGRTVVFNLTTSKHWKSHPVGIIRVERELAKYLSKLENTIIKFVIWDPLSKKMKWLTISEVAEILSDQWVKGEISSLTTEQELLDATRIYELTRKDVFVSLGLDWDLFPTHEIATLIQQSKAKAVLGCYDLIPILFPEYCVRPDFDQVFKTHFIDMGHCASRIWVDSNCSKKDLTNFLTNADLGKELPQIKFIPLGADSKSDDNLPELTEHDASILRHVNYLGDYIIYVSSFESRKNHRLLVNIWRELYQERGDECPQLVIVGMKGWGVDDLLNLMPRMFVQKAEKINFLPNVSDDLLVYLYKQSRFGVFPSLYEGWGLAAAELLSFDKACIISSNSALVEATQGLMPAYHPLDFLGWKAEIEKLWDDTKYRTRLEKQIRNKFTPNTWESFSENFARQMLDLEIISN